MTDDRKNLLTFIVQLSGSKGEISTIHIESNGLYFAIPQHKLLSFPSKFTDLEKFIDDVKALFTMKQQIERLADMIPSGYTRENDIGKHFGRTRNETDNELLDWTRETWYTPPRGAPMTRPKHLYSSARSTDLSTKLPICKRKGEATTQLKQPVLKVDHWGFAEVHGKFYNTIPKKFSEKRPLHWQNHVK